MTFDEWWFKGGVILFDLPNKRETAKQIWNAARQDSKSENTSDNTPKEEINTCIWINGCGAVRVEGKCRGVTCNLYKPY
jgi:hypothetical protein